MTGSNIPIENTTTTAGDEFAAAKSDCFLQQAGRLGSSYRGVIKGQSLSLMHDLIDGVRAILPAIVDKDPGPMSNNNLVDHIPEKANHTMLRHVARLIYL